MSKNEKHTLLVVSGTRPDTIKQAPLILELKKNPNFITKFVVTGQHEELLDMVLNLFNLVPDINYKIMRQNQKLTELLVRLTPLIEQTLKDINPDLIIVQGDTLTSFIFSLIGFSVNIPIAHTEAGLRSNDIFNPFPEESYRRMISSMTTYHFPPTQYAKENILREFPNANHIYITGNTVIDSMKHISKISKKNITLKIPDNYILFTMHRRENLGDRMIQVFKALKLITENTDVKIIYPTHPNPRIIAIVERELKNSKNISLINPVDYPTMIHLIKNSNLVITDSGGLQEESVSMGIPVLVTRETTERPEGIQAGLLKLVGTNTDNIVSDTINILNNKINIKTMNPYGDGKAVERIVSYIEYAFGYSNKPLPEFKPQIADK